MKNTKLSNRQKKYPEGMDVDVNFWGSEILCLDIVIFVKNFEFCLRAHMIGLLIFITKGVTKNKFIKE